MIARPRHRKHRRSRAAVVASVTMLAFGAGCMAIATTRPVFAWIVFAAGWIVLELVEKTRLRDQQRYAPGRSPTASRQEP